jgi:hypothetical protein
VPSSVPAGPTGARHAESKRIAASRTPQMEWRGRPSGRPIGPFLVQADRRFVGGLLLQRETKNLRDPQRRRGRPPARRPTEIARPRSFATDAAPIERYRCPLIRIQAYRG